MKNLLIIALLALLNFTAKAQTSYAITGTVKNVKSEFLASATVFIAGSQKATATNASGQFVFNGIAPGTYQVVVNMLGYASQKQNVIVKDGDASINVVLAEKVIELDQVTIGSGSKRTEYLKTFIRYFMGESANARASLILNPEIIEFATAKNLLKASTDKFLEIENKNLGYKVKYLLRSFQYNKDTDVTYYDGESVFEPMTGTAEQQHNWETNRAKAYEGSMMQYLRGIYDNTSREQGFLTYVVVSPQLPIMIAPNPVYPLQLIKKIDSNFVTFTFKKRLYIEYNKKKAAKVDKLSDEKYVTIDMANKGSMFMIDAEIDKRGSFTNPRNILVQGYWGTLRIGDQLPIEYLYVPQKK